MEPSSELKIKLARYARETEQLEFAYKKLQNQFYLLKKRLGSTVEIQNQIFSYLTEGLMFVTKNGIVTMFNPAAAKLTDCVAASILNASYWLHFSDTLFGFSMREVLQKDEIHHRSFLTLQNEREIEVSTSSIPGKGILLLLSNRTEQMKLQKSINHAERLQELGEMAATLAHEIRNPLAGIDGFARLLKRDVKDVSQQGMIHAILEGASMIDKLVSNVLDYSRPLQLHLIQSDLIVLAKETISFFKIAKKAVFLFESRIKEYPVLADREKIKLVLLNVLHNALDAGATKISIQVDEKGTLKVMDNGIGISSQNLKKIFTPFFTTKSKGTGLGLAASLSAIQAHNGSLEIASEAGKGTQVTLKLPKETQSCE
jgi:two-component system, NtrC family, sensor histidine kinase AtoS